MPDLGFALDGLYACGWWPTDDDRCRRYTDGRWYPDEPMILESFAELETFPDIRESTFSGAVEVVWRSSRRGRQSILGRSREEALILAFTSLYQENLYLGRV